MQSESPIQYKYKQQWHDAKCDKCLYDMLGSRIDIQWNAKTGKMRISKSEATQSSHIIIDNQIEIIKYAHFCHSGNCPFNSQTITQNPTRDIKPCACVLLKNKETQQVLITKRAEKISFPGAWVLPGGHLEKGQGIFDGGIRQCQEEVGLPETEFNVQVQKSKHVMVWESVFTIQNKVKASGLIIFFATECPNFQVKALESEVSEYKWKKLGDISDQIPYDKIKMDGYAEGHRKYLNIIRQQTNIEVLKEQK